jgi:hypothetical protein
MFRGRMSTKALPSLLIAAMVVLCSQSAAYAGRGIDTWDGWRMEHGVEVPSYAAAIPEETDLNIDVVVLGCEQAENRPVLQLQVYLTDEGPLRPKGADASRLKPEARAELAIDGRIFPVSLLFADDYAVIADADEGPYPKLSEELVDAMQIGGSMVIKFDLVAEEAGQAPHYDGKAVIDLRGGRGAIAAVRRCASPERMPGTAQLQH